MTTHRALDCADPRAPHFMWYPTDDGLSGWIFVFGFASEFSDGDYIFFRGSSKDKRRMYRIVEKTYHPNENHQWQATLEYMATAPDEPYTLWPPADGIMLME